MATATSGNPDRNLKRGYRKSVSDVEVVADTIVLEGLSPDMPHCFVGIQFFSDAGGTTPATPGAGTVTVTVETVNSEGISEAVPDNVIDATAITTVSWDANTKSITLVPAGVTTATHWRATWTGNES